eukprot:TRINITY_DN2048_c0_g1_i1.p1 TRINITY_DN2048_c0_g1~~TRINITY_DN2048_c0_g1_i1.p1  ORF type:complete len:408 (-),score=-3.62 TRINITY_DN2048_c0_g1_i1:341-1564(-)
MDQSPVYKTIAPRDKLIVKTDTAGAQTIVQDINKGESRFATLVGLIRYDVLRQTIVPAKQMLIFEGTGKGLKDDEKEVYQKNKDCVVHFDKSSWCSDEAMKVWIDQVLKPIAGASKKILLVIDSYRTHITNMKLLQTFADVVVIPGGLTLALQYLDVYGFASMKSRLHKTLHERKQAAIETSQGASTALPVRCNRLSARWFRETFTEIVPQVWRETVENISDVEAQRRFAHLGYVLPVSGEKDHQVQISSYPKVKFTRDDLSNMDKSYPFLDLLYRSSPTPFTCMLLAAGKSTVKKAPTPQEPRTQPKAQPKLSSFLKRKAPEVASPPAGPAAKKANVGSPETTPSVAPATQETPKKAAPKRKAEETAQKPDGAAPAKKSRPGRSCRLCGKPGHYAKTCTSVPKEKE